VSVHSSGAILQKNELTPLALRFPEDLTKEEAEKVAGVVRNLWLGPRANSE
jgi:hypothetical protein